jgi:hypothetical protein
LILRLVIASLEYAIGVVLVTHSPPMLRRLSGKCSGLKEWSGIWDKDRDPAAASQAVKEYLTTLYAKFTCTSRRGRSQTTSIIGGESDVGSNCQQVSNRLVRRFWHTQEWTPARPRGNTRF